MADVFDVANYILEISREESEDGEYELISHMKLQNEQKQEQTHNIRR